MVWSRAAMVRCSSAVVGSARSIMVQPTQLLRRPTMMLLVCSHCPGVAELPFRAAGGGGPAVCCMGRRGAGTAAHTGSRGTCAGIKFVRHFREILN